jgi:hypothetical protein
MKHGMALSISGRFHNRNFSAIIIQSISALSE